MIVSSDNSLFSLQKLCLSSEYKHLCGRYVLVNCKRDIQFICQICVKRDINPNLCVINKSVITLETLNKVNLLHGKLDLYTECKSIEFSALTFIESVPNLKNININVVFKNAWVTSKWKSNIGVLKHFLKEAMKFFVVSNNSLVFLGSITANTIVGIYCVNVISADSSYGKVTSSTSISIENILSKNWIFSDRIIPDIGGFDIIYKQLKEYCTLKSRRSDSVLPSLFSCNVLLTGPSGCGKTTLAQRVAFDCGYPLLSIIGSELCHPQPGVTEKAIKAIFKEAKLLASEKPNGVCVVLLDQIECFCSKKGTSHVLRAQSALIQLLDSLVNSSGVFIIGTTDQPDSLSPAIRRPPCFTIELMMGVPTKSERQAILSTLSYNKFDNLSGDILNQIADWTPGYIAADLALLMSDTMRESIKLQSTNNSHMYGNILEIFRSCLLKMRPSTLRGELGIVPASDIKMSDIGGMIDVKNTLKRTIEWPFLYQDAFKRLGISPTKGILLYGPPGCAKTSLVRAISNSNSINFLAISAASIYSPYVGDAERTVSQLFQRARLSSPTILFIDEIDALVGSKGSDSREKGVHERVLSAFLIEMDGIGIKKQKSHNASEDINVPTVIVVAATNQPVSLDPALLRPGRFDRLVYVGPPDYNDRLDILSKLTKKMPLGDDVELEDFANMTSLYSGADLSRLCKEAALNAMTDEGMAVEEIKRKHWMKALNEMRPSLTEKQIESYKYFRHI